MGWGCDAMANMLDCDIIVSLFELQLHDYIHSQTKNALERYESSFFPEPIDWIVPLWFFYKDSFGIKNPWKFICHKPKKQSHLFWWHRIC